MVCFETDLISVCSANQIQIYNTKSKFVSRDMQSIETVYADRATAIGSHVHHIGSICGEGIHYV